MRWEDCGQLGMIAHGLRDFGAVSPDCAPLAVIAHWPRSFAERCHILAQLGKIAHGLKYINQTVKYLRQDLLFSFRRRCRDDQFGIAVFI
jgi:hypothetical protein